MRRFFQNRSGNVAVIFALTLLPITLVVGASVDLSRMRGERTELQAATDAAALAAANLPSGTSNSEINRTVRRFMRENFDGLGELGEITITRTGSAIRVDSESMVPQAFLALFGDEERPVRAMAEATRSFSFFEVVMVLDNSGSMDRESKIGALKDAANSLVDTMAEAETEAGSVKIGLVPFTIAVNVGSQYANADWMDTEALSPEHTYQFDPAMNRFDLFEELDVGWAGCVDTRAYPFDVQDDAPTVSNPSTLFVPFFAPDEPDTQQNGWGGWSDVYPNNYLKDYDSDILDMGGGDPEGSWQCSAWLFGLWNCNHPTMGQKWTWEDISGQDPVGGGGDEMEFPDSAPWWVSNDTSNNAKIARQAYAYKYWLNPNTGGGRGPNANCNVDPIVPLTDDFDALEDAIDDMDAVGYTNIHQGAMWGWRLLSPGAPFTEGAEYGDADTRKFLIILTDGQNNIPQETGPNHNKSLYGPYGYARDGRLGEVSSHSQIVREMDNRLAETCTNAKAAGIVIYTISFDLDPDDEDDADVIGMMDGCATDGSRSFISPNSASLQATFDAIVNDITQLRLSR